ncbi:MAG: DUF202 domain-containing protein [Pseudomonadota bacterium]
MPKDENASRAPAEQRTDWAEDRTILANERTFASWMRTGMACVGVALGLKAVFGSTEHPLVAKAVAELFIFTAVIIFGSAARRSYLAQKRIDDHDTNAQSHIGMIVTAISLTIGAIAAGVILWLL